MTHVASQPPYALNTASSGDLEILREWIKPYRPQNDAYITHLTLGAITLMGSTLAFLEKASKTTIYSQNGPVVENITFEPSLFATWTTVQKCIFVAVLVIIPISMFVHYKVMNKREQLAIRKGIEDFCNAKLKDNEFTVIEESKESYLVFAKTYKHSQMATLAKVNTWIAIYGVIKNTKVDFKTILSRSNQ